MNEQRYREAERRLWSYYSVEPTEQHIELAATGTKVRIQEVGTGEPGPVTRQLQQEFFGIVSGEIEDRHGWLTRVPQTRRAAV